MKTLIAFIAQGLVLTFLSIDSLAKNSKAEMLPEKCATYSIIDGCRVYACFAHSACPSNRAIKCRHNYTTTVTIEGYSSSPCSLQ